MTSDLIVGADLGSMRFLAGFETAVIARVLCGNGEEYYKAQHQGPLLPKHVSILISVFYSLCVHGIVYICSIAMGYRLENALVRAQ